MAQRSATTYNRFRENTLKVKPNVPENKQTDNHDESYEDSQAQTNASPSSAHLGEPQPSEAKKKGASGAKRGRKPSVEGGVSNRVMALLDDATYARFIAYSIEHKYNKSDLARKIITEFFDKL